MSVTGRPSRRRFLRGIGFGGLGLAAGAFGTGALAACGGTDLAPVPLRTGVADLSRAQRVVRFANWPDYVDSLPGNHQVHPTLAEFTRRTGIVVEYSEPVQANDQFVGQLGVQLALGRSPGYDLVVVSDWMVAQLIELGWIQPLSPAAVPNAARLVPAFRNSPLPDVRRYALPWQGGFTGIAWNLSATHRPVTSMSDLLTSPDLRGRVGLVAEMGDVMGLIMLGMGVNPAAFTDAEFDAALRQLDQAAGAGQVRTVTNDYTAMLASGEIAACTAWAGDILDMQQTYPQLRFALPEAGGMLWTDNMVIPAFTPHKENAERLMNFYYEPAAAAQLSAYEQFICPVLGTQAVMRSVDPALAGAQYVFPPAELLARGHHFKLLSPALNKSYNSRYATAVGF
jgi:spermidine/putrescine transport system substrate-binding protein